MAILAGKLVDENKVRVESVTYTTDIAPPGYFQVDEVPDYPEPIKGINHVRYFNPLTKEIWYEEEPRELTEEEEKDQRIADLEIAIANILGGAV